MPEPRKPSANEDPVKEEIKRQLSVIDLTGGTRHTRVACPYRDCAGQLSGRREVQVDPHYWYCHICKRGGDQFNWVMVTQNCEFKDARRALADRLGIPLVPNRERQKLLEQVVRAANDYLFGDGKAHQAYLVKRGIPKSLMWKVQIGYVDMEGEVLARTGLSREQLIQLGLVMPPLRHGGLDLHVMAGRFIFPIRDMSGRLVQLKGRADPAVLDDTSKKNIALRKQPEQAPREWGSHSHMHYLFLEENLDRYKENGAVIVCEGEPDALTLVGMGFPAVGLQTSQGIAKHAHKLKDFKRIYVCLDNDKATTSRLPEELYELQMALPHVQIFNATIPPLLGHDEQGNVRKVDVNDFIVKHGKRTRDVNALLKAAVPVPDLLVDAWGPQLGEQHLFDSLIRMFRAFEPNEVEFERQLARMAAAAGRRVELLRFVVNPARYGD